MLKHIVGKNDLEWGVSLLQEHATTKKHNYKITTEICTLEEYMDETDARLEDIVLENGAFVRCYVRAVLQDDETGYYWRIFCPAHTENVVGYSMALNEATTELLKDYFAYLDSRGIN